MTDGQLKHAGWAEWEPCENCGVTVCAARQVGVLDAPVSLREQTGWINGRPSLGKHSPRRCAAIRAEMSPHPFVGEAP